jgi:hypothetical protein
MGMNAAALPTALPQSLAQALALPASAHVGQRIAKTLLMEQIAQLPGSTAADKRLISDQLAELQWLAALKPSTCGLAAWQTESHEVLEIAVLQATLKANVAQSTRQTAQTTASKRLIELIHRCIPYPVVLILRQNLPAIKNGQFSYQEQPSLAHKRLPLGNSKSNSASSAMVLELLVTTKFISPCADNTPSTAQFLQYLAFNSAPSNAPRPIHTLHERYSDWLHAAEALAAAEHTGHFQVSPEAHEASRRRSALAAYEQLRQQLSSLRAQARKESQLAGRAALNLQIAALIAQQHALQNQL